MSRLIDSHCHVDFTDFDNDRAEMLMRAHQVGVMHFVVPGVTRAQWPRLTKYQKQYQNWHIAFGLHPYFIDEHQNSHLNDLVKAIKHFKVVAVGEIGLDEACDNMAKQERLFGAQVEIAVDHDLPVILHHRKTLDPMLKIVRDMGLKRGVVHAFSGSQQQAEDWIEQGFKLGVGGVITYDRAQKTRTSIAAVPLEALVLETDSPDMPMSGQQGKRNEPANITRAFDALCELRHEGREVIAQALWQNSVDVFNLPVK